MLATTRKPDGKHCCNLQRHAEWWTHTYKWHDRGNLHLDDDAATDVVWQVWRVTNTERVRAYNPENTPQTDVAQQPTACIVYSVQCTVYSVQCTVYSVQCTVYSVQCTVYSVQCTVYSVQCTVYSVQCTVYSVQCTVYSVQCIVYRQMLSPDTVPLWP